MSASINALLHGWSGIALAYGAVQAPMLVAMVRRAAAPWRLALAPLVAVPVMAAAGGGMAVAKPLMNSLGSAMSLGQLLLGTAVSAGLGYASGRVLAATQAATGSVHLRGAMIGARGHDGAAAGLRRAATARSASARPASFSLALGGVAIAARDEVKHFKLIGATGSGKSTAITELLQGALARGDRAVIADPDGGYLRHFYDARRGDVILNPFEPRAVRWDPFAELKQPYDAEQLARLCTHVPDRSDAAGPRRGYA